MECKRFGKLQTNGSELEKSVRKILPAGRFAGEWPNEKRILEIHIVGGLPEDDPYYQPIRDEIKRIGIEEIDKYVEMKSAKYSLKEINTARRWVRNNWPTKEGNFQAIIGGSGLGAYNYTIINLLSPEIALTQSEAEFIITAKEIFDDLIRFEYMSTTPVLELL